MQGAGSTFGCLHRRDLRTGKENRSSNGQQSKQEYQPLPVFAAKQRDEQGTDGNHHHDAPGIDRVELAHLPVGIVGRDSGNDRADQNLTETGCGGEDDGADHQTQIDIPREKKRPDRVEQQAAHSDGWDGANGLRNIKTVGEEGEDQIDDQLGEVIQQYQQSQLGIGDPVHGTEGQEQDRREIRHNGHGGVGAVARQLQAFDRIHFWNPPLYAFDVIVARDGKGDNGFLMRKRGIFFGGYSCYNNSS